MANNIRKFRKERGIKVRHFAQMMDVTENYIWKLETGKKRGSVALLMKMANHFGCTLEELIGSEN